MLSCLSWLGSGLVRFYRSEVDRDRDVEMQSSSDEDPGSGSDEHIPDPMTLFRSRQDQAPSKKKKTRGPRKPRKSEPVWTSEEDAELTRMMEENFTWQQIQAVCLISSHLYRQFLTYDL